MKIFATAACVFLLSITAQVAAACPEYLQGDYRKLHSSDTIDLCALTQDKVVLVVNTASHCGYTKQFEGLEALHETYKDEGLIVVGFASDDFNQEAKDEAAAADICFVNFGVTFTMFAPTSVRGGQANPLFRALAAQTQEPAWNFNKYLLDKNGKVISHFDSGDKPQSKKITSAIEQLL
jgi:glutathione peroxidase